MVSQEPFKPVLVEKPAPKHPLVPEEQKELLKSEVSTTTQKIDLPKTEKNNTESKIKAGQAHDLGKATAPLPRVEAMIPADKIPPPQKQPQVVEPKEIQNSYTKFLRPHKSLSPPKNKLSSKTVVPKIEKKPENTFKASESPFAPPKTSHQASPVKLALNAVSPPVTKRKTFGLSEKGKS